MALITIGNMDSKICATCLYWNGPNVINSAGYPSNPKKMDFDIDKHAYGQCINKRSSRPANSHCDKHEYNYQCQRYL